MKCSPIQVLLTRQKRAAAGNGFEGIVAGRDTKMIGKKRRYGEN